MIEYIVYLGSKCNLNCPYCHKESTDKEPELSGSFFNLLEKDNIRIIFKGGEPLLYFDIIQKIVDKIPYGKFSIHTNGVLLNKYKDYLKEHNFEIIFSYDGENTLRNYDPFTSGIDFENIGVSCTLTHQNHDLYKIIDDFKNKSLIIGRDLFLNPHIAHYTNNNNKDYALTIKDYDELLKQYKEIISLFIDEYINYNIINYKYASIFFGLFDLLSNKYKYGETPCCNKTIKRIDLTGNIYNCLYIRDNKLKEDWLNEQKKNIELVSNKCKTCKVYNMCGAGCLKSRHHSLECYFKFNLYSWFKSFYKKNKKIINSIVDEYK